MLRAYMHGFFIEMSLYSKLRAVSKPFEYEEHRKARIRDKVEERRQSRITAKKRLPSVNKQLAEKFLRKKGVDDGEAAPGEGLVDDRFSALFKREEFEQDQESFDFRLRNPTLSSGSKKKGREGEEDDDLNAGAGGMFKAVEEDLDEEDYSDDDDMLGGDGSDSGDSIGNGVRYESDEEPVYASSSRGKNGGKKSSAGKRGAEDSDEEGAISKATRRILSKRQLKEDPRGGSAAKKKRSGPQMFELADGVAGERAVFAHTSSEKARRMEEKKLGRQLLTDRLKSEDGKMGKGGHGGASSGTKILKTSEGLVRELTYMPQKSASSGDRLEKASKEELREEKWSSSGGRGASRGGGRGRGGRGGGRGRSGRGGGRGRR
jgi:ribosome biogenesis protein ENP2